MTMSERERSAKLSRRAGKVLVAGGRALMVIDDDERA
jgi:hypothetical protein